MTEEGPDGPKNEINWNEILQKIVGKKGGVGDKVKDSKPANTKKVALIVLGIVIVLWGLTGIYTVGPGEEGVVRRFGNHTDTTSPGLNYHLPWPIEKVNRINVEQVRTTEIGFRSEGIDDIPAESQMLTGDENIVKAQMVVQYRVQNAADFLFNLRDPEQAVQFATEVALRSVVGSNTIDFVIIEGRTIVQSETMAFLQRLMDDYNSGIQITEVKLQEAFPPDEVKDAFNEVVRAREDKQTLIREAEGYAADRVPKARGEAEQTVLAAEAYKQQRVLQAEGDASKFLQILREHEVPAAFQALAGMGVKDAVAALAQVGAIEPDAAEGTATPEAYLMNRETLAGILKDLGVISPSMPAADVTSQTLFDALNQLGIAAEYQQSYLEAIQLTRERLFLETMENVLPDTKKIIVDPATGGNLLPFLDLNSAKEVQQ